MYRLIHDFSDGTTHRVVYWVPATANNKQALEYLDEKLQQDTGGVDADTDNIHVPVTVQEEPISEAFMQWQMESDKRLQGSSTFLRVNHIRLSPGEIDFARFKHAIDDDLGAFVTDGCPLQDFLVTSENKNVATIDKISARKQAKKKKSRASKRKAREPSDQDEDDENSFPPPVKKPRVETA